MRGSGFIQVTLGVVLLMANPIGATDTRVETLGASALFLEDEDNIWHFPASILEYPNLLVLSLGGRASALTPRSEFRILGTIPLPQGMVMGMGFGSDERQVTYAPLGAKELLHLFIAKREGSRRTGLSISQYGAINNNNPSYEKSVSVTRVSIGIEAEQGSDRIVEGSLAYCGTYFKDISNRVKRSGPKGYHELALQMRGSIQLTESVRIIPILTATLGARGARTYSSGQVSGTVKQGYIASQIGAAYEISRPEDLLVIFHASILYSRTVSSPAESKNIIWSFPQAGVGIEKWIRPWLALRAGAILHLQLRKNTGNGDISWRSQVSTAPAMGLAIRFSGLQADFAFDPAVLENGLYFMSGTKAPLFTKVTLRYHF
ncbi:hypothetical protein ACFL4K_01130 [Candidatus Neomarinimicrobiota bacterium]